MHKNKNKIAVVWTPKGKFIERIDFSPSFWKEMESKLDFFWNNAQLAAPERAHKTAWDRYIAELRLTQSLIEYITLLYATHIFIVMFLPYFVPQNYK